MIYYRHDLKSKCYGLLSLMSIGCQLFWRIIHIETSVLQGKEAMLVVYGLGLITLAVILGEALV